MDIRAVIAHEITTFILVVLLGHALVQQVLLLHSQPLQVFAGIFVELVAFFHLYPALLNQLLELLVSSQARRLRLILLNLFPEEIVSSTVLILHTLSQHLHLLDKVLIALELEVFVLWF